MIKLLTVIGARPQIIKAAALSRAIKNTFSFQIKEYIIHTGQHYDTNMSDVFFEELGIPTPDFNLQIGSGSHGETTGKMIVALEKLMLEIKPDYVIVYGDTNSTLAGAVAASKINIPIVHIEAGLRSFNKRMPEEINRIMCDHASTLLFSPTEQGFRNLLNEGFKVSDSPFTTDKPGIFHCGDIMLDNSLYFSDISNQKSVLLEKLELFPNAFNLCTIHRAENTDSLENLEGILSGLLTICEDFLVPLVLPLHPRTKNKILFLDQKLQDRIDQCSFFLIIEPVSYLDMIALEKNAKLIITDSGGVQKEAYFFKKPCIILRNETEWIEIIKTGSSILVGSNEKKIVNAFSEINGKNYNYPEIFGDGNASIFICDKILNNFQTLS
jgi:UDP-GlcNAc3NAcA epimerase